MQNDIERDSLENANDCPEGDQAIASTQQLAASSQYTSPNSRGWGNGPEFTIESSTSASNVLKTLKDITKRSTLVSHSYYVID